MYARNSSSYEAANSLVTVICGTAGSAVICALAPTCSFRLYRLVRVPRGPLIESGPSAAQMPSPCSADGAGRLAACPVSVRASARPAKPGCN